jgi:hypothetical protein
MSLAFVHFLMAQPVSSDFGPVKWRGKHPTSFTLASWRQHLFDAYFSSLVSAYPEYGPLFFLRPDLKRWLFAWATRTCPHCKSDPFSTKWNPVMDHCIDRGCPSSHSNDLEVCPCCEFGYWEINGEELRPDKAYPRGVQIIRHCLCCAYPSEDSSVLMEKLS